MNKIIEFVPKKKYRIEWSIEVADDLPPCKVFLHLPEATRDYIRVKLCVNSFKGIQRAKEQVLKELKGEKIMFCPIIKEECKKTECVCFNKKRTRNVQMAAGNEQPVLGECSLINSFSEVEKIATAINKLENTIHNTDFC